MKRHALMRCGLLAWAVVTTDLAGGDGFQSLAAVGQAAREHLAGLNGIDPAGVETGPLDARLHLPACDGGLQAFMPPGSRSTGVTTVGVRCGGTQTWTLYVPATVRQAVPVVVATRLLPAGTVVQKGDVTVVHKEAVAPGQGVAQSPEQVIGKTLKQAVTPGAVLRSAVIHGPRVIRRGDAVTLVVETPGIEVRAAATALTDGAVGDVIRVRNILNKKEVEAVVTSPATVQVRM